MNQKLLNLLVVAGDEAENIGNYALASALHSLIAQSDNPEALLKSAGALLKISKEVYGD